MFSKVLKLFRDPEEEDQGYVNAQSAAEVAPTDDPNQPAKGIAIGSADNQARADYYRQAITQPNAGLASIGYAIAANKYDNRAEEARAAELASNQALVNRINGGANPDPSNLPPTDTSQGIVIGGGRNVSPEIPPANNPSYQQAAYGGTMTDVPPSNPTPAPERQPSALRETLFEPRVKEEEEMMRGKPQPVAKGDGGNTESEEEYWATKMIAESGGNPNAVNKNTKAAGLFQNNNVKGYTTEQLKDPVLSYNLAKKHDAEMRKIGEGILGRKMTNSERYAFHQQGSGGGSALLENPDMNAIDALTPAYVKGYGDKARSVARQAVVLNGGKEGMTSREFFKVVQNHYNRFKVSSIPKRFSFIAEDIRKNAPQQASNTAQATDANITDNPPQEEIAQDEGMTPLAREMLQPDYSNVYRPQVRVSKDTEYTPLEEYADTEGQSRKAEEDRQIFLQALGGSSDNALKVALYEKLVGDMYKRSAPVDRLERAELMKAENERYNKDAITGSAINVDNNQAANSAANANQAEQNAGYLSIQSAESPALLGQKEAFNNSRIGFNDSRADAVSRAADLAEAQAIEQNEQNRFLNEAKVGRYNAEANAALNPPDKSEEKPGQFSSDLNETHRNNFESVEKKGGRFDLYANGNTVKPLGGDPSKGISRVITSVNGKRGTYDFFNGFAYPVTNGESEVSAQEGVNILNNYGQPFGDISKTPPAGGVPVENMNAEQRKTNDEFNNLVTGLFTVKDNNENEAQKLLSTDEDRLGQAAGWLDQSALGRFLGELGDSDTAQVNMWIDNLSAGGALEGVQKLKGTGSVSNADMKFVDEASRAIDTSSTEALRRTVLERSYAGNLFTLKILDDNYNIRKNQLSEETKQTYLKKREDIKNQIRQTITRFKDINAEGVLREYVGRATQLQPYLKEIIPEQENRGESLFNRVKGNTAQ